MAGEVGVGLGGGGVASVGLRVWKEVTSLFSKDKDDKTASARKMQIS